MGNASLVSCTFYCLYSRRALGFSVVDLASYSERRNGIIEQEGKYSTTESHDLWLLVCVVMAPPDMNKHSPDSINTEDVTLEQVPVCLCLLYMQCMFTQRILPFPWRQRGLFLVSVWFLAMSKPVLSISVSLHDAIPFCQDQTFSRRTIFACCLQRKDVWEWLAVGGQHSVPNQSWPQGMKESCLQAVSFCPRGRVRGVLT